MTDEQIIKALECCKDPMASCDECFLVNADRSCERTLMGNALDLINRQKAEIERLNKVLETNIVFCGSRANGKSSRILGLVEDSIAMIQEDAIKEFAEECRRLAFDRLYISIDEINNLVKEMVGDTE